MNLSAPEIRVLGCLLEKQRTTPDQYPLTLNGLRLACNQSTNRDPVVQYDDDVLRDALHRLARRGYIRLASGAGSRTAKYRHLLAEALPMGEDEQAVMCVLMLRGAQTPGELKQRTERMHPFADLAAVHDTLERLIERELVERLSRRPGQKEERYAQLLEDRESEGTPGAGVVQGSSERVWAPKREEPGSIVDHAPITGSQSQGDAEAALTALEERVARMERELLELRGARTAAESEQPQGTNGLSERPDGNSEPAVGVSQT